MAYTPPSGPPPERTNDYSMLQWFDPQAQQNAKGSDWQKQWNAANYGSPAAGQGQDDGLMLPGAVPKDKDGYWVNSGDRYVFIPTQGQSAPAIPMQQQAEPAAQPPAPANGKTIYNDWDTFQNQARAGVEAGNNSPFVNDPQKLIGLTPDQQMQRFYPAAWQEGGVQKNIGPNGQNIAPYLNSDFDTPQFLDTTKQDMPSLVAMLLKGGNIDQRQSQALLDLMKPKTLDTSFATTEMKK